MTVTTTIRQQIRQRSQGRCEWPLCLSPAVQVAHIRGKGLGGNPDGSRDVVSNLAHLCLFHHDMLDGRRRMKLWEVESLLLEVIAKREPQPC